MVVHVAVTATARAGAAGARLAVRTGGRAAVAAGRAARPAGRAMGKTVAGAGRAGQGVARAGSRTSGRAHRLQRGGGPHTKPDDRMRRLRKHLDRGDGDSRSSPGRGGSPGIPTGRGDPRGEGDEAARTTDASGHIRRGAQVALGTARALRNPLRLAGRAVVAPTRVGRRRQRVAGSSGTGGGVRRWLIIGVVVALVFGMVSSMPLLMPGFSSASSGRSGAASAGTTIVNAVAMRDAFVAAGVPAEYADEFVATASLGVDPRMVAAVAWQESVHFDQDVIECRRSSPAGARGIMQFMPSTAAGRDVDACDPASAIPGGARFLLELYGKFTSWDLAFAGYNAGPGAVEACMCVPQNGETDRYVPAVNGRWDVYRQSVPEAQFGRGPGPEGLPAGAEPERAEIIRRAQSWIDIGGLPYSQAAYHDGWRTDCSGYVSTTWNLQRPGANTVALASTFATRIELTDLLPGDILLDADPGDSGHVILFERWDADPNFYWGYEQASTPGGTAHRRIAVPGPGSEYVPYRSNTFM